MRPHVHLDATTNNFHLAAIYTGLSLLARSGRITLSQECRREPLFDPAAPQHLRRASATRVRVRVTLPAREDPVRVCYDCYDGEEVDPALLESCDLYFKRSYREDAAPAHLRERVRPLGLIFAVYPHYRDRLLLSRILRLERGRERLHSLVPALRARLFPTADDFTGVPEPDLSPRVLFMARAWDPADQPDRAPEKVQEREAINEGRAAAIRALRRWFGRRFSGGFSHTEYARRRFPKLLIPDAGLAVQSSYLRILREYPVCIATIGLHNSNGYKLGEYVSLAKAVVSEPPYFGVPGKFEPGVNYLPFRATAELLDAVERLLDDRDRRAAMMEENARYAREHVRADALVAHTLREVQRWADEVGPGAGARGGGKAERSAGADRLGTGAA